MRIAWLLGWFVLSAGLRSQAQLVSGNAFLKGRYVEVGIAPYGCWGTTVDAPADYHPRSDMLGDGPNFRKLGFVADPDKDGWEVGSPSKYNGDYFLPANPYTGWGISIGDRHFFAERANNGLGGHGYIGISQGMMRSVTSDGQAAVAVWETNVGNLLIRKIVTVPVDKAYFSVRTVFLNTGSADLHDVYYLEYVNPDNDAGYMDKRSDYEVDANTHNAIAFQNPVDALALVTAMGDRTGSYMGLGSKDCRSKVFRGKAGYLQIQDQTNALSCYTGTGAVLQSGKEASSGNCFIGIDFNIGSITAGDSTAVTFSYILAEKDLTDALNVTAPMFLYKDSAYSAGATILACPGDKVPMTLDDGDGMNWTWAPSDGLDQTTGTHVSATTATAEQTYTLTGTGTGGCTSVSRQITITIKPDVPAAPVVQTPLQYCQFSSAPALTAEGAGLLWYQTATGGTGSSEAPTPSTAAVSTTTWYVCQTSATGCYGDRSSITVDVHELSKPSVTIDPMNPSICAGSSLTFTATAVNGGSDPVYEWKKNGLTNGPGGPVYVDKSLKDGDRISCQLLSSETCASPAQVESEVSTITAPGNYLMPMGFTPNGDGHNDCFGLRRNWAVSGFNLQVYNRFGQKVFESQDPAACWDGTYQGVAQPVGTYVYFIHGAGSCGIIDQRGTITLVR